MPVCVGRSRTERSRAAIPRELRQQRAGPKAFSEDQALFKNGKLTLEMVWRTREIRTEGGTRKRKGRG